MVIRIDRCDAHHKSRQVQCVCCPWVEMGPPAILLFRGLQTLMLQIPNLKVEPVEGSKPRAGSGNHQGRRKPGGSIIMMSADRDVMTLQEAAEFFQCNPATIKRRADPLHIPYKRMGSLWRFSRKALEAWMADADNDKAA